MNEPVDPLLARLSAADPVEPSSLPSSQDPHAQQLMRSITGERSFGAPPAPPARHQPRRRFAMLAGAAAAATMLVGGIVVLAPKSSTPALAVVHQAADQTAADDSGRATTSFVIEGQHEEDGAQVAGSIETRYDDDDLAITLDIDQASPELEIGSLGEAETRMIDGVIYATGDGEDWMAFEAPAFLAGQVTEIVDPRSVLDTVRSLVGAEEIGSTTVDGVTVTQYRSVVDVGDETLRQSGWMAGLETQVDIDPDGEVTIDLYVDADGYLHRFDVIGDVQANGGTATFAIETVFDQLGEDQNIEAPANVEVRGFDGFGHQGD